MSDPILSLEERAIVHHYKTHHSHTEEGRFISFEWSLNSKGQFGDFKALMREYMDMGHAELVSAEEQKRPEPEVFMHAVYKSSSTSTKIRAVFDASAKSSSGVSLNDTLLVGPTVHPSLIDG